MKSYLDWEFETINNFDYKLSLASDYTDSQFENIIAKYGENTSETVGIEFKKDDEKIVKPLTINNSNGLLQVTNHNREPLEMKDSGLYITEKMAAIYDLSVGDTVEWHIIGSDKWYNTEIVRIK